MFEKNNNVLDEPSNTVFRVTYYVVAVIAGKYVTDNVVVGSSCDYVTNMLCLVKSLSHKYVVPSNNYVSPNNLIICKLTC